MAKIVFKAKTSNGVLKFPNSIRKNQIVIEKGDTRLSRYENSDLFLNIIYHHLRSVVRLTLGTSIFLGDLPEFVSIKEGFLSEVTIDLGRIE
jgi:hypothetical protein